MTMLTSHPRRVRPLSARLSSVARALTLSATAACSAVDGAPTADAWSAASDGSAAFSFLDLSNGGAEVTRALYTDAIDVRLSGLVPGSTVEIHARNRSAGVGYEAYGVFAVGDDGSVDVATSAPIRGTYTGVDPDGLVWSGEQKPLPEDDAAWAGDNAGALLFTALVDGAVVARAPLRRYALGDGITKVDVTDDGLVGAFRMPSLARPRGAVIAFGGSEGGLGGGLSLAARYASLGYPTLAVAYFDAPGLPTTLSEVPLEYFQKARDWLAAQPGIDPNKIVVAGGSRGGELALLLGATFPWVSGVIAQCPSGLLWGDHTYGAPTWNTPAWTYGGEPLPFVPFTNGIPTIETLPSGETAMGILPVYQTSFDDASSSQVASATIPVEATKGPVLMQAGSDDAMWMSCSLSEIAMDRLRSSGHADRYRDSFTCYPGAGHNVYEPGFPAAAQVAEPGGYVRGGNPADIARAQRDADTQVRAFLRAALE